MFTIKPDSLRMETGGASKLGGYGGLASLTGSLSLDFTPAGDSLFGGFLLNGLSVIPHRLCEETVYEVQRHPIKKRRRGWRVVKMLRPAIWKMGNTLFMHPDLYRAMREQAKL